MMCQRLATADEVTFYYCISYFRKTIDAHNIDKDDNIRPIISLSIIKL